MKKLSSIFLLLLVLASGMRLGVATHLCSGRLASVRFSVCGEKASCGMSEQYLSDRSIHTFSNNCCRNFISVVSTDGDYELSRQFSLRIFQKAAINPTAFLIKAILPNPIQLLDDTVSKAACCIETYFSLAFLCVLRR